MTFTSQDRKECLTCTEGWVMIREWQAGVRSCKECLRKKQQSLDASKRANSLFRANSRIK